MKKFFINPAFEKVYDLKKHPKFSAQCRGARRPVMTHTKTSATVQDQLRDMAREIIAQLSELDSPDSKEQLLGNLVSELFLSVAQENQQRERRRRQAEGIAAAKARGVRFGASRKPLPENFDSCYTAWREGEMSLTQAAEACGMVKTSFRRAIDRREQAVEASGG